MDKLESVIWSAMLSVPRLGVMRWSGYIEDEHSTLIRVAFDALMDLTGGRWYGLRFCSAKKTASCRPGPIEIHEGSGLTIL